MRRFVAWMLKMASVKAKYVEAHGDNRERVELEEGMAQVDAAVAEIERDAVSQELVREALGNIAEVFGSLKPIQQKEMLRLVSHRAGASDTEIALELYGKPPDVKAYLKADSPLWPQTRSETPKTLPGLVSQSVFLRFVSPFCLRSTRLNRTALAAT